MIHDINSFNNLLKKRFPNNDVTVLTFTKTTEPITYKCNTCGKEYYKTRAGHLYENKTLCSRCYSAKDSKIRDWIRFFLKNTKNFTLAEPWCGTTNVNLKLHCNNCNKIFEKEPANLYLREDSTICPYCGNNGSPMPLEFFLQLLTPQEQEDYEFLEYRGKNIPAKIKHKCGFVYTQTPRNFLQSRGCPQCERTMSVGERKIERFLTINNIPYERQKRFSEIKKYSYDFFLPEQNLLIEYQGEQHYKPVERFGGVERFKTQQKHDALKKEYAKNNNYNLLEIPYYDLHKIESYLEPLKAQRLVKNDVASSEAKRETSNIIT